MPLRKSERWAVGLTALSLALTLGYHAGTARRAPEVTVRAESLARPPATETLRETERINLNTATEEELTRLRGVGEALAQRIVAYREEHGPFRRVEEITRVNGIGQAVLENNWSILTVEEDTT
ncbi:MAG: ComEA family DNA-binding protein [Oscillospiraceae bacterium]|nr:ComEA family DNA-binding protein [Oscillospiraceae bacterium]